MTTNSYFGRLFTGGIFVSTEPTIKNHQLRKSFRGVLGGRTLVLKHYKMLPDDNSQGCFFSSLQRPTTTTIIALKCLSVRWAAEETCSSIPLPACPAPLHWTLQGWIVMFVHKDIFGTVHAYFCLVLQAKLDIIRCLEIVGVCDAALLNAWLGSLARLGGGGLPGWCAEHSVRLVCSAQS